MTHGYEFFDYDYFDLDELDFGDWDDSEDWDSSISESWGEIEDIYEEYETNSVIEGW